MEHDIHQKIEERLAELPQDVQEAIASSELGEKLQAIGRAQALHIDQMEALSDEVMLAMLGFIELDDLPHGIERQVRVDSAHAQAITDAVNREIFLSIRESMKAWAAKRNAAAAQAPEPLAPTPTIASSNPSVMMPSSVAPITPSAPMPAQIPVAKQAAPATMPVPPPATAPTHPPAAALAPKPAAIAPNLAAADAILSEKKVTPPAPATISAASAPAAAISPAGQAPKADPAQPQPYAADPYREPVE